MKLEGLLEAADAEVLAGWVIDMHAPEQRICLQFHVDGKIIGRAVADRYRKDLAAAGKGDGHCFFVFRPPRPLNATELAKLTVRGADHPFIFTAARRHLLLTEPASNVSGVVPNRKWRCVLHIGTQKTGSTSLQRFLSRNRTALAEMGYFTPISLCDPADRLGMNSVLIENYAKSGEINTQNPDIILYRSTLANNLSAELSESPKNCHTLLISSENCHGGLRSIGEIKLVRDLLEPFCESVKVLVYIRPQHELALSVHGMLVREGRINPSYFPSFCGKKIDFNGISFDYFDYENLINLWSGVFGQSSMIPRIFDHKSLVSGDIVDDFLFSTGICDNGFIRPIRLNTNLTAPALRALLRVSKLLRRRPKQEVDRVRAWLIPRLPPGGGFLPARHEVVALMAQFAASNEAVRAAWFPHREALFSDDFNRYPEVPECGGEDEFAEMMIEAMLAGKS